MQQSELSKSAEDPFTLEHKPMTALIAGARFLGNIQETSHFFRMTDAIDSRQNEKNYRRYIATSVGAALDAEGVNFADILKDRDMLRRQPAGSLALAYLDFMTNENLQMEMLSTAEIKANASTLNLGPSRRNFVESGIALHDLYHVITGYGRHPIGEACVLAFTAAHFGQPGVKLLAHALAVREQFAHRSVPVLSMVGEAKRIARNGIWIAEVDWRAFLALPIEAARAHLGMVAPRTYLLHTPPEQVAAGWAETAPHYQQAA